MQKEKAKRQKRSKKARFCLDDQNDFIIKKNEIPFNGLIRYENNPLIRPNIRNNWESRQTFNPAVIFLENKVHILYRAIGEDWISRLGYASSTDGFHIDNRLSVPVYEHKLIRGLCPFFYYSSGGSFGGAEDPRIVRVDREDVLYMTYTACDGGLGVALTSIKVSDFLNKKWLWKKPQIISNPGEYNKNWVIFPEKINNKYAILHSISPQIGIDYRDSLDFKEGEYIDSHYHGNLRNYNTWDNWFRGAAAPPIKTEKGWLLFYHAMDVNDPGKYKVGAMLLDLDDPTKIICRSPIPVLEPETDYENNGFKAGVVYVTGAIKKDENIIVYYGGADSYVCTAYLNLSEFLQFLLNFCD